MEATVTTHKSQGCIWKAGELIAGWEPARFLRPAHFSVVLCVKERQVGPRGGIRQPAESVAIEAQSWAACVRAIERLGFTKPHLTASEVRRGR